MKLTPEPLTTTPLKTGDTSQTVETEKALAASVQLKQLKGQLAKVESSQKLEPRQAQAMLEGLKNPLPKAILKSLIQSLTSSPAPSGQAAASQPQQAALLEIHLLKVSLQQNLISLLSTQPHNKGQPVLIQQNTQGQWVLQTPTAQFSLNNIASQFASAAAPMAPLPLKLDLPSFPNTLSPPKGAIQNNSPLNGPMIEQAIKLSGQFLEAALAKQASAGPQTQPNSLANSQTKEGTILQNQGLKLSIRSSAEPKINPNINKPNFAQRFNQVEQQIQKWIQALPTTKPMANAVTPHTDTVAIKPITVNKPTDTLTTQKATQQQAPSQQDSKAWLSQLQVQLLQTLKQINSASQLKPSPMATLLPNSQMNAPADTSDKTFMGIKSEQLFYWLTSSKPLQTSTLQSDRQDLPLWPRNLSVQGQIHRQLQGLLQAQQNINKQEQGVEAHEGQNKILRQLLQVSQSLMRMQHEQINNKLGQTQQPDTLQLNLSVPYQDAQMLRWCELELKEQTQQEAGKKKTLGWHLVLRFQQNSHESFAIESQLNQYKIQITLWAKEQNQLAKLHKHTELFRQKLITAGFEVASLQSKRGLPQKNQRQIKQSLIDVRT